MHFQVFALSSQDQQFMMFCTLASSVQVTWWNLQVEIYKLQVEINKLLAQINQLQVEYYNSYSQWKPF